MRIARLQGLPGAGFAVSADGAAWTSVAELGVEAADTAELIEAADGLREALSSAAGGIQAAGEALLCPVVRPRKIIAVGLNYASHAQETGMTVPERPLTFAKYPSSLNDPFGDVVIGPEITEQADYESEIAVIIGRPAKRVSVEAAMGHVFGYAVANDVSSREWQKLDGQFSRSKSADGFCPIGPWITTADEVPELPALELSSAVNGEPRQAGTAAQMIFDVPFLISYLSRTMTLETGDVLLTGTPPGVGQGFTPPRFLRPGDVVECTVSSLGTIRNRFVAA